MKRHIEDGELETYMEWTKYNPIIAEITIHIENERKTSFAAGNRRKKKGVRAGVSDIFIPYPTEQYHGLWIEMKGPKNIKGYRPAPVSGEQKVWIGMMRQSGYEAYVCYGANEAIEVTTDYLMGKRICLKAEWKQ